jgi:hypothetical protein
VFVGDDCDAGGESFSPWVTSRGHREMSRQVEARVTLRIPRDGRQALAAAVVERLGRAAVVERVDDVDLTGVRPGLNDLQVDATAALACDDAATSDRDTADVLSETTGIETVEVVDREAGP